jgi:2-haloacid dehalogenase
VAQPHAVIFDVGNVLYHWDPRNLYERLISDDRALEAFLSTVVTRSWHFQHDQGRPFAETSAELIGQFPEHKALIAAWGPRFDESMGPPVAGMLDLVAELDARGVPLFAITNFSGEFWPPFRAKRPEMFASFRDVIVSGDEKLLKPDPAIYQLALQRFGLKPGEAVFVDDVPANAEAATREGIEGLVFKDAATLRAELAARGLLPA